LVIHRWNMGENLMLVINPPYFFPGECLKLSILSKNGFVCRVPRCFRVPSLIFPSRVDCTLMGASPVLGMQVPPFVCEPKKGKWVKANSLCLKSGTRHLISKINCKLKAPGQTERGQMRTGIKKKGCASPGKVHRRSLFLGAMSWEGGVN